MAKGKQVEVEVNIDYEIDELELFGGRRTVYDDCNDVTRKIKIKKVNVEELICDAERE